MILSDEQTTGEDLLDFVKDYRKNVLDALDERLGPDFPLWDLVEQFDREQDFVEELKEHRGETGAATPTATDGTQPAAPASTPPAEPAATPTPETAAPSTPPPAPEAASPSAGDSTSK